MIWRKAQTEYEQILAQIQARQSYLQARGEPRFFASELVPRGAELANQMRKYLEQCREKRREGRARWEEYGIWTQLSNGDLEENQKEEDEQKQSEKDDHQQQQLPPQQQQP